ncbi:MAG: radical SAM protein [Chloroflexota bacterium]
MNDVAIQTELPKLGLSPADAILQTVSYAGIFSHPLTVRELHRYLIGLKLTAEELDDEIIRMLALGSLIQQTQQRWTTLPGNEKLFGIRAEREERSRRLWPLARHYGRLVGRLPFVRMVAVTGSLAVNNPDPKADIDLFIITEPDRLWLTRLMTVGIVKLAARQGVHLCPNYFITTKNLTIETRNLYTAREICQMVPLSGHDVYHQFRLANHWTTGFLPNSTLPSTVQGELSSGARVGEYFLSGPLGDRLEQWEMNRKIDKFVNQNRCNEAQFSADQCKGHFDGHQERVLAKVEELSQDQPLAVSNQPSADQVEQLPTADVLFGQSYYLRFDPKLYAAMQPYPPLGTMIAAAYVREKGYKVDLFDAMLAESTAEWAEKVSKVRPRFAVIYEDNFNYLSKMCLLNMRDAAIEMVGAAKQTGATVILCGSDATDHPGLYLKAGADYVIQGEGEETLLELLTHLNDDHPFAPAGIVGLAYWENGQVKQNTRRPVMRNIDRLPFPAWDLIDVEQYRQIWLEHHGYFSMNMVTTRGCPYHCNWCAKPIWGQRFNARSAESVAEEMAWLKSTYRPDHIWFVDDIMGLKQGWLEQFAAEVEKRDAKLPFKCLSRADLIVRKKNNVQALAQAGCDIVWLGAESGAQHILNRMDKGTTVEQIYDAADQLHKAGVKVAFFLQFGYPGETREDIEKTLQMVRDCRPDDIGMSVSYPLPGTRFHENVKLQLGTQQNWTDSADLAMMYQGPFVTDFYRQLHIVLHKEFRSRKGWQALKTIARKPAKWRLNHARELIAIGYRLATLPIARSKLNRLSTIPHEGIETLPHMSLAEAAAPTQQD